MRDDGNERTPVTLDQKSVEQMTGQGTPPAYPGRINIVLAGNPENIRRR
jgi:hypothetical protein